MRPSAWQLQVMINQEESARRRTPWKEALQDEGRFGHPIHLSFQRRCRPPLMRSFITSYDSATLPKTPSTLAFFSPNGTSSYPASQVLIGSQFTIIKEIQNRAQTISWRLAGHLESLFPSPESCHYTTAGCACPYFSARSWPSSTCSNRHVGEQLVPPNLSRKSR